VLVREWRKGGSGEKWWKGALVKRRKARARRQHIKHFREGNECWADGSW